MEKLQGFILDRIQEFDQIPAERKELLKSLAEFIKQKKGAANLIFVCTHNSRRSHLAQVWAQVAAFHYNKKGTVCYSGGTEATALFYSSAEALQIAGIEVMKLSNESNPVYALKYEQNAPAVIGFSKKYDHPFNPQSGYGAIMVCDSADQNCPYLPTADARFAIKYVDPKEADGTPEQLTRYIERSQQIAREMLYAFSIIQ